MKLRNPGASIFIPDGISVKEGLDRTTHMAISAHQDDIEIMAAHGVIECYGQKDKWFCGVVTTNGAGSPRAGIYADYSDEEMREVRKIEQRKAGFVGDYSAVVLMDYASSEIKNPPGEAIVTELQELLLATKPSVIYTHNLADKHDTHVATAVRLIQACRELPADARPEKLLGGEVWRDLDWMSDTDKVALDCSPHENLQAALLGVFDSQIAGGKRYDLASMGRRKAHATYHESHGLDVTTGLNFAMDLTPLIEDPSLGIAEFLQSYIDRFAAEVRTRVSKSLA
jgi:LmbE family N-acetylglucosaminyl deacetylase